MKQFEVKRKQIEYLSKALEVILFLAIERKLGLEGSGFFLVPLMLFAMIWNFAGEQLPDVLAKLIRVRKAKGQLKSIKNIRLFSLICQVAMGVVGTLLMLSLGTFLGENVYGCPYASLMIWILSPVIFLRGMSYLLQGYCQGEGSELPTVVTCLLRPVAIYLLGTVLGSLGGDYGLKVTGLLKQEHYTAMYVGAGWCAAITIAELVIILFLFFSFLGAKKLRAKPEQEMVKASVSFRSYVSAASKNMAFRAIVSFTELFPVCIGMIIYYHREGETAPLTYGTFFVGYFATCLLIYRLLNSVAVPFWSKIGSYFKRDELRLGRVCFQGGIHMILGLGMILAVSIAAMPAQVGALAGFTSPNLTKLVFQGSLWLVFAGLGFYFSRTLMRFGKNLLVAGIGILTDILFVMVFMILWNDEKMALLSMMYALLISEAIHCFLIGAIATQMLGCRLNWFRTVLLPIGLAVAIGILQALCVKFMGEHLESIFVVIIVGGAGFIAYWCILILLRNFSEEELSVSPFGKSIKVFGDMMGIYEKLE